PQARPRTGRLARGGDCPREHARCLHLPPPAKARRARGAGRGRDRARRRLPARMSRFSIRTRLLLAVLGVVAVAVVALTVGFNLLLARSLSHNANDLARQRATAQLATLRSTGSGLEPGDLPDQAAGESQIWIFSRGKTLRAPP